MTLAVANITDAVVARGQRAWNRIKATAAEQRELWRQVGEALAYGRLTYPNNQKFGQWCKDNGFGDMDAATRSDAIWFASYRGGNTIPADLSHPKNIRQWVREQEKSSPLPDDLKDVEITPKTTVEMDDRTAEKVGKLARRAAAGDEGSQIAKRHLEAVAKKYGISTEDLAEAASVKAPQAFYQFTPTQLDLLKELEGNVFATVVEMEATGINREAIAKVFMNVAQKILKGEK